MDLQNVIVAPVITEKARGIESISATQKRYCFKVHPKANKELISQALHKIYGVKVEKINTMIVPGKYRRFRRERIKLPNWKKAIVVLAPGQEIDLKLGV